jgi:hypothetical protein
MYEMNNIKLVVFTARYELNLYLYGMNDIKLIGCVYCAVRAESLFVRNEWY